MILKKHFTNDESFLLKLGSSEIITLRELIQSELIEKVNHCDEENTYVLFQMLSVLSKCEDSIDLPF